MEDYRLRSPAPPSYHSLPARPAAEALSEWIDNFITLTWIPWRSTHEPYRITTVTSLRDNTETELVLSSQIRRPTPSGSVG